MGTGSGVRLGRVQMGVLGYGIALADIYIYIYIYIYIPYPREPP
jgi:hypothetical protein